MGTRPQTLYGLADSPIDLAAFMLDHGDGSGQPGLVQQVLEERLEQPSDLTRDDILDNITLFWLTNTGVSSARLYWENKLPFFSVKGVKIPVGVSTFADEIYRVPRSWAEQAYPNLVSLQPARQGRALRRLGAAAAALRRRPRDVPIAALAMTVFERVHMPSFAGATEWLNSEPLGPAELRGHVVLVNFWTLTCINWLRQEPYVRAWSQAYRDDGLVVIGVHTPEFSFEHEHRPRAAGDEGAGDRLPGRASTTTTRSGTPSTTTTGRRSTSSTGTASSATSTSAKDATSSPSASSSGCSASSASSSPSKGSAWRRRPTGTTCARPRPTSATGAASSSRHRAAPRSTNAAPTSSPSGCTSTTGRSPASGRSGARSVVLDQAGGSIAYRFHARDAHLVLSPGAREPIPFRVLLDGEAPGPSHGVDVDEDGNGVLRDGRLYQLVRQHDAVRERTLEITFLEPGAEAYAFTFG